MSESKGNKYSRSLVFAATGFLFILFLILWYKQYTCFNYGEGGLYMDRLKLAVITGAAALAFLSLAGAIVSLGAFAKAGKTLGACFFGLACVCSVDAVVMGMIEEVSYMCPVFTVAGVFTALAATFLYMDDKAQRQGNTAAGAIAAAAVLGMALFFLMLSIPDGTLLAYVCGGKYSLTRIAGFCSCFGLFIILFLLFALKRLMPSVTAFLKDFADSLFFLPSMILILICLMRGQFSYFFENAPVFVKLISAAAVAALLFFGRKLFNKDLRLPRFVFVLYYGLILSLVFAQHCIINFWGGEVGDLRHTGIFYRPLYIVDKFLPFGGKNMDIYGHYALFYKPFLMIFGNNMRTVGTVTAVVAALSMLFILLIMHALIRSDILKIFGGFILVNAITIPWLYLQNFPCRFLFPAMILYFILRMDTAAYGNHEGSKVSHPEGSGKVGHPEGVSKVSHPEGVSPKDLPRRVAGCILCMLATLWNTETGAVCALSFSVYIALKKCEGKKLKELIAALLKEVPFMGLEVLAAFGITALYNLAAKSFGTAAWGIFSRSSEIFVVDHVTTGSNGILRWSNAPWLYIMILFMILTGVLLYRLGLADTGKEGIITAHKYDRVYICALLMSLGYFVYWMTRPEEYAIIAAPLAMILLVLYEKLSGRKDKPSITALIILSLALTAYVGSSGVTIGALSDKLGTDKVMSASAIEDDIKNFELNVPKDCYGYTYGLPMIYMQLGWDIRFDRYVSIDAEDSMISDDPGLEIEGMSVSKTVSVGKTDYYLYERVR